MSLPDAAPVRDLIEAFRRSKTMFAAVSMGVFDRLHERPARATEMAAALGVNADALERLLDGCAALGLLRKRDGVYTNDPVAEAYLVTSSPDSLCGYVRYSNDALFPMWSHLEDAVREGTHRWFQTFGLEGPAIFDHFFRSEQAMREFLRGLHGFGVLTSHRLAAAFDLSRFRRMADLGGATGHLIIACCERYANLRGVVFDLPRAAAVAREYIAASPARDRIEIVAGDFFEDPLPEADLYSAGQILHDWSEEKIGRLLGRVFQALPAGGALLVAEKLLNEDGVGPAPANLHSLNMLIVTEGKERTLSDYDRLMRAAGFSSVEGVRTGAYLDAVLAVKASQMQAD